MSLLIKLAFEKGASFMTNQSEQWDACPPGTMRRIADRVRPIPRQPVVRPYASAVLVGMLLAVTGVALVVMRTSLDSSPGGLACVEIMQSMNDFSTGRLDPALHERVHQHLLACRACRTHYETHYGPVPQMTGHDQGISPLIGAIRP